MDYNELERRLEKAGVVPAIELAEHQRLPVVRKGLCGGENQALYLCTLNANHKGCHIAHTPNGDAVSVWKNHEYRESAVPVPYDLWTEILDYIEGHEDTVDGDDGQPRPNAAMHIMNSIRRENLDRG